GVRATHVVHVDPAVGKYEVRGGNVFLVAPVLAGASTCDVPDGRSFGHQKRAGIEIGHGEMPRRFEWRRTTKRLLGDCDYCRYRERSARNYVPYKHKEHS